MSSVRFVRPFLAMALITAAHLSAASTTPTYAVGTCKPALPSFQTISAALGAMPSPSVVMVCPGTYPEQIEITLPVTLEGVPSANQGQAIIAVPGDGLVVNATDDSGNPLAAQVWVNNASGPVNLIDITVDGAGGLADSFFAGILFLNSPGLVNRVTTRNQTAPNSFGVGIFLNGGDSNPSVTVENSSIHDFTYNGIRAFTSTGQITPTIKSNNINATGAQTGITLLSGAPAIVANNSVIGAQSYGINLFVGSSATASGNSIINSGHAQINIETDGVSVINNKLSDGPIGILVRSTVSEVRSNSITRVTQGIDFNCSSGGNVHGNFLNDVDSGLIHVPDAVATPNSFFNVATLRSGGC